MTGVYSGLSVYEMSAIKKKTGLTFAAIVIGGAILLSSWLAQRVSAVGRDAYDNIEAFAGVLTMVQKHYVDDVSTKQLIDGAINGMLASLDPHSAYLTPELYKELQVDTRGSFGGLGIEITLRNGILTVVSPIEDTPAFRSGIKAGDQIIKIEHEFTKDMTLVEAVKRMRGPEGTKIHLTVRREGVPDWIEVDLKREVIQIKSVKFRLLEPGYGYLRVTQFQERTERDARKAIEELQKQSSGPLSGLVLDLRNNPGGLLSQAVRLSDLFLDSGVVVYTEGRLENQKQKFFAHKQNSHTDVPMIVLVNGGSASASEIVAGALQDHRRALLLGTQTFGKGSVQTILELPGGAGLKLTTMRYYTPSGHSIQAQGIQPDIVVESSRVAVEPGRVTRERDLEGHLPPEEKATTRGAPVFRRPDPPKPNERADADTGPRTAAEVPVNPVGGPDFALSIAYQVVRGVLGAKK
jgi:carboxyl-terminal processing protease